MATRQHHWTLFTTVLVMIGLVNLSIAAPPPGKGKKKLALSVTVAPATIAEDGSAMGTVSHNNSDLTAAVQVTLTSSDAGEATVPASVEIPIGNAAVTFPVDGVEDGIADGEQLVSITATATDYQSATANLTVKDVPIVRYEIQFIDGMTSINDRNNSVMAVGRYQLPTGDPFEGEDRGSLYDPLIDPAQAIDLNSIVEGIPAGWVIASAVGINDHGDIVGRLRQPGAPANSGRGFVIDWNATDANGDPIPPQLYEIPDAKFGAPNTYGRRINENGDVVGVYFPNDGPTGGYLFNPGFDGQQLVLPADLVDLNPALAPLSNYGIDLNNPDPAAGRDLQIVGSLQLSADVKRGFRYTLGDTLPELFEPFTDANGNTINIDWVAEINQTGAMCGRATVIFPKKIKGQASTTAPYRAASTQAIELFDGTDAALAINDAGDFTTGDERLYLEGIGYFDIYELIDPTDPDTDLLLQGNLILRKLTNPLPDTSLPAIFGWFQLGSDTPQIVLLTPIAAP